MILAAFVLVTNCAWGEDVVHARTHTQAPGKHGATAPANRMGRANGKQPHKQKPRYIEEPSFSVGASHIQGKGKGSGVGKVDLGEIDPNGSKETISKSATVKPPPK
jgi:hypothetical protein